MGRIVDNGGRIIDNGGLIIDDGGRIIDTLPTPSEGGDANMQTTRPPFAISAMLAP
jgi:hypothetical protein